MMADRKARASRRTPRTGNHGQGNVQALSRGLTLLDCLASEPRGLLLTDIARRVGLAASTTHRLLATLEHRGFAELEANTGLWRVGAATVAVGSAFIRGRDFVSLARPYMRELSSRSGETSNLAIERDLGAVYVAQVESSATIRAFSRLGDRVPLACSGVGLALLSAHSAEEVEAIIRETGLPEYTANSITSLDRLHRLLEQGRLRGYVVDDEYHVLGMRCVAAPFFDGNGEPLAAISLSGPAARLSPEKAEQLGQFVAATSCEITQRIGGRST
ncbi:MAG: IclR family transcriptional regulator [Ectothiorhodospiraceae bacterium]|nr:IclR family transcriptional regulator [Ectothiorhodospiraceae bacterium]